MKCANCDTVASHEYKLTLDKSLLFCEKHLPSFLQKAKRSGLLSQTEEHKANLEEGLKNIAVTPEPEPTPVVDTTPTPKTAKKSSSKNADNS
jgi:hypothetical protein